MYTLTFCRIGKSYKVNNKGYFKKEFNTLDEIVKFYFKVNRKLYCPKMTEELTRREMSIFYNKISSLLNRNK